MVPLYDYRSRKVSPGVAVLVVNETESACDALPTMECSKEREHMDDRLASSTDSGRGSVNTLACAGLGSPHKASLELIGSIAENE